MNRRWLLAVLAGIVVVWAMAALMPGRTHAGQGSEAVRWEYKAVVISGPFRLPDHTKEIEDRLNALGRQGWELADFEESTYVLKRCMQQ